MFSALTIALIDTLSDKIEKVRDSVAQSIVDTGKKLPKHTIILCTNYLDKHPKLPESHRAAILRVIERILNYQQQQQQQEGNVPFDKDTFQLLTRVAITELTIPKVRFFYSETFFFLLILRIYLQELIPLWQQAASDVLVEIGKYEPDMVCNAILPHMQPGQLPPFFVLQTIGSLAEANRKIINYLK